MRGGKAVVEVELAPGKFRQLQHMSATTFWSPDGEPMSSADFVRQLFGELPALFHDEDELRRFWSRPDTRQALLDTLAEKGYGNQQLKEIGRMVDAEKSDLFDVLAYIAFKLPPLSRVELIARRRKVTWQSPVDVLPDGAFFEHDGQAYLVWEGRHWRWSFDGYQQAAPCSSEEEVEVLTPPSTVKALLAGFRPEVQLSLTSSAT
ncbi:hypothetical protein LG312_13275 [Halomonas sp.]